MLIVIAIIDELINTQLLVSRAESTHSDSVYPFVGLSTFTEGLHQKDIDTNLENLSQVFDERSHDQRVQK